MSDPQAAVCRLTVPRNILLTVCFIVDISTRVTASWQPRSGTKCPSHSAGRLAHARPSLCFEPMSARCQPCTAESVSRDAGQGAGRNVERCTAHDIQHRPWAKSGSFHVAARCSPGGDCRVASIAGIRLMNGTGQAPRWVLRRSSGRLREGRLLFNVRGGKADDRRGTLEHSSLLTHLHHHSPSKSEPALSQVHEAV